MRPNGTVQHGSRVFDTIQQAYESVINEMTPLYDLLEEDNGRTQTQAPA